MYTSVKTRKKTRHVGPTCLKIPGENTAMYQQVLYVLLRHFARNENTCSYNSAYRAFA